jgi:hypothetical protein
VAEGDSVAKRLVDEIAADLATNAGLPAHTVAKYRRPRAILPDDCPLLCVWLEAKTPTPRTTKWFDSAMTIGVSWHEESVAEVETLVLDEDVALALMSSLEKIEARVRVLAAQGLTDAWEVLPGESRYLGPEMQQSATEGFALAIEARLTEA